jgi:hypothetical protein
LALSAYALAPCFLLCHLDNFIVTHNSQPYPRTGAIPSNFHYDTKFSALSRDQQKTHHRDADGT